MVGLSSAVFLTAGPGADSKSAPIARRANSVTQTITSIVLKPTGLSVSQHRTDPPRHEFLMPQCFAARPLTGGHAQQQIENFAAYFSDALLAIGNRAGIHIHVVLHTPERIGVARDLDHGNIGKADGAAAARGEGDHIATPRSEAGKRDRIVPGCIHENKPRRVHRLGVIDRVGESGTTGRRDGAQRFFQNVGETAFLVSGRWIIVETAAEAAEILLI